MSIKLLAGVAVIAAGVGLSGAAPVHAAPSPPPPCLLNCPDPSGPQPGTHLQAPNAGQPFPGEFGGGPKTGGRVVG
jgi:hypothetical protein